MRKGYIVCEEDGRRVPVGTVLVAGRTPDCDLFIDDSAASRRHIEIRMREGAFHWKDLGSTNGTYVNEARMLAGELKDGDLIQIGETRLQFEVVDEPDEPPSMSDSTLFRETILDSSGVGKAIQAESKATALLEAVYTVMNEIATNYEPCLLMDRILEAIMRGINAQRGAILLAGQDEALRTCPVCNQVHTFRDGALRPMRQEQIRVSHTVVNRVLRNGESVLYQDTDHDGELNASESIMSLKLRSIICVPLRAKHGIIGILYLDSDRESQTYTHEDMLLTTAVGNSAGLALENAQMHQQILEKQRIEQEIATAWTIQEGFLVKDWPEDDPRFEVYGETRPAKTVGGDFYDFIRTGTDTIGVLIGDVSGKGVPAALTMAQLLAEFRSCAQAAASPAAVLRELNLDLVQRSQRGMFCTLCYLVLDLKTGRMVVANAGHSPVLRITRDGVEHLAGASGPPAGILADATWEDCAAALDPGDSVLLYTDGIAEARRVTTQISSSTPAEPEQYAEHGLLRKTQEHYGAPPRALIETLNDDVRRFTAPSAPHDDCTMIAVRYLGAA